ncbi:DUF4148 domain-containing protein [Paraburkholderia xenovorans]|uniref:DUF4148 domain-containing protein n=1 Tax=Paraburkholderia xenovorans TaxID=36873 RepID=UPI0038BCDD0A
MAKDRRHLAAKTALTACADGYRAQVRAELVQLEKAGYQVGDGDHTTYPAGIQAAEARVAAQNGAASGYGGVTSGSSEAGRPAMSMADSSAMYSHH